MHSFVYAPRPRGLSDRPLLPRRWPSPPPPFETRRSPIHLSNLFKYERVNRGEVGRLIVLVSELDFLSFFFFLKLIFGQRVSSLFEDLEEREVGAHPARLCSLAGSRVSLSTTGC